MVIKIFTSHIYWVISSGTQVRKIVTLVPAEQESKRLKLRHLNFNPYPSRTRAGPCVTFGSYSHISKF